MSEPVKPGILDRLRARFEWFDHAMRANDRFDERKGNFYAAGLTYYTIFALFPLLMVAFSIGGFLLARRPDVLASIDNKVRATVPGALGQQVLDLVNSAINSRTSVGVIGLATAAWVGLGWISNFRVALGEMWHQDGVSQGFIRTKFSDLTVFVTSLAAILATLALSALASAAPMAKVLGWLGFHNSPVLDGFLRAVSILLSLVVSWFVFSWMIARLPRQPVKFGYATQAALIAAIGFELFKVVASIYLRSVLHSPAGATFGPVLGLMVFVYVTARLILFAAAWAATTPEAQVAESVKPPAPAVITPRVHLHRDLDARQVLTAGAVGAIGALGLSRLLRRNKS
jgi:membrane protein